MTETLQIVYEAIDELNETRDEPLPKSEELVLAGEGAALDSMGLVSLILVMERLVEEKFGKAVMFNIFHSANPFRTPATLAAYIGELLREAEGGDA